MAIWQAATITGDRAEVDSEGVSFVRFLSPKFVQDDGAEFGTVGYGINVIEIIEEE